MHNFFLLKQSAFVRNRPGECSYMRIYSKNTAWMNRKYQYGITGVQTKHRISVDKHVTGFKPDVKYIGHSQSTSCIRALITNVGLTDNNAITFTSSESLGLKFWISKFVIVVLR